MNIDGITNGLVIDHIEAGKGMDIYNALHLGQLECSVALIKNVISHKMGKKDIIKVDEVIDVDLNVLGFIDPSICVNVIENEKIVLKINMELPSRVQGVFKCKNPRCITQTEHYVKPTFLLTDKSKGVYKCEYCDTLYLAGSERR